MIQIKKIDNVFLNRNMMNYLMKGKAVGKIDINAEMEEGGYTIEY
jgi:hypothetical protein